MRNGAIGVRNAVLRCLEHDDVLSYLCVSKQQVTIACTTRAECAQLALLRLLAAAAMT